MRYEYAEGELGPVRRFRRGNLTAEYAWRGLLLTLWRDYEHELEYRFFYAETGIFDNVHIMPLSPSLVAARALSPNSDPWHELAAKQRRESLRELIGSGLTLACGCDQVGTPKLLTHGDRIIKQLTWDSFGNLRDDTLPKLSLPIGFAGGLTDRDTGLVRCGYRDYDPAEGRFTAPDPANDRRGDGDIYDYCVDDPVSRVDPTGLWTQETFEESRVRRDGDGQFSSSGGGGGTGQKGLQADAQSDQQHYVWDRKRVVEHLHKNAPTSAGGGRCARAVRNAIEAGGVRLNRNLNSTTDGSASGYGPILEAAGFVAIPVGAAPQANDVAVIQPTENHKHGHMAMFDGQLWYSDFKQERGMYPNEEYRRVRPDYTIYRLP